MGRARRVEKSVSARVCARANEYTVLLARAINIIITTAAGTGFRLAKISRTRACVCVCVWQNVVVDTHSRSRWRRALAFLFYKTHTKKKTIRACGPVRRKNFFFFSTRFLIFFY